VDFTSPARVTLDGTRTVYVTDELSNAIKDLAKCKREDETLLGYGSFSRVPQRLTKGGQGVKAEALPLRHQGDVQGSRGKDYPILKGYSYLDLQPIQKEVRAARLSACVAVRTSSSACCPFRLMREGTVASRASMNGASRFAKPDYSHQKHHCSKEFKRSRPALATMKKIAVALPMLLMPLLLAPVVYATQPTRVLLSGVVTGPDGIFTVRAEASGTTASLSGGGTDSPPPGPAPPGNPGVCHFRLTGFITGTVVTLSGVFDQSSLKSLIGLPVVITADASTGAITFAVAGGTPDTGTGAVTIS
jgi:hypothetical protein